MSPARDASRGGVPAAPPPRTLVGRLVVALGPGLERSRTPDADWVVHVRPGAPAPRPPAGARLSVAGPVLQVRVADADLVAALDDRPGWAAPGEDHPADDVPAAWARATGRAPARFAQRRLDNPAYGSLVVLDRARRGIAPAPTRRLLVALADLPRTAALADAGRPHRLAEGVAEVAAAALATGAAVPVPGSPDLAPHLVGTMAHALRRLGVPAIERV